MSLSAGLSARLWLAALASATCVGAASGAALRPGPEETTEPPTPQLISLSQTDMIGFDPRIRP